MSNEKTHIESNRQPAKNAANRDRAYAERLFGMVYAELRRVAAGYLKRERANHTLQPTALVHEAYLKLANQHSAEWKDSAHFAAVAAECMRRILVDHARRKNSLKRGSGQVLQLTLSDAPGDGPAVDLIELEDALNELATLSERQARIVELRFFGGLTVEEIARVLEVSYATVKADWRVARAWLGSRLAMDR